MTSEMPQMLGNRFSVDRMIAEGGMARVYRGTDTLLGRPVAVKVLSSALAEDPAFVARFEREAKAVASLSHPNVVAIFDIGSENNVHYIVMEYVAGTTLDSVIRAEAPLGQARVATIASGVCEALAAAHTRGIIHRDIKPANIMVEPDGRVKVMDFGIAKTGAHGLTQVGAVLGTVKYLAPEQADGRAVDERTDIYALGCVMYEMLTGHPPILGESLMEMANRLANEDPPLPSAINSAVSAQFDRVVMKALAKDPGDRYSGVDSMYRDLEDFALDAGGPALTRPLPTPVQPVADSTRVLDRAHPALRRPGMLALGLLLIAVGAVALFQRFADDPTASPQSDLTLAPPAPAAPPPGLIAPSPTPDEGPASNRDRYQMVRDAAAGIAAVLEAGVISGEVSERASKNILGEVEDAVEENEDDAIEDALEAVEDAREELAKYLGRDEVSVGTAAQVDARLDVMAQAIVS